MSWFPCSESPELGYALLLKVHTCYDAIPVSNKIRDFDTQLSVKKAFYALLYNSGLPAALSSLAHSNQRPPSLPSQAVGRRCCTTAGRTR